MGIRFYVVCEDRAHEQFLRGLLEGRGLVSNWAREVRSLVAPKGRGAASQFVLREFPEVVNTRRSKSFQQSLGVLGMIDGDNLGSARHRQLLESLDPARATGERIAVLVPTWSIETWAKALAGEVVDETTDLKGFTREDRQLREAGRSWEPARRDEPPMLTEGRRELLRL
jgi:hypothetical protein